MDVLPIVVIALTMVVQLALGLHVLDSIDARLGRIEKCLWLQAARDMERWEEEVDE